MKNCTKIQFTNLHTILYFYITFYENSIKIHLPFTNFVDFDNFYEYIYTDIPLNAAKVSQFFRKSTEHIQYLPRTFSPSDNKITNSLLRSIIYGQIFGRIYLSSGTIDPKPCVET
jgi:hypothetical protein